MSLQKHSCLAGCCSVEFAQSWQAWPLLPNTELVRCSRAMCSPIFHQASQVPSWCGAARKIAAYSTAHAFSILAIVELLSSIA